MAACTELDILSKEIGGVHANALFEAQNVVGVKHQMHVGATGKETRYFRMAAERKAVLCLYLPPLARAGFIHGNY